MRTMLNLNLASRGSPAPTHVQQITSAFCKREGEKEEEEEEGEGGREGGGGERESRRRRKNECKSSPSHHHSLPPSHCSPNLQ